MDEDNREEELDTSSDSEEMSFDEEEKEESESEAQGDEADGEVHRGVRNVQQWLHDRCIRLQRNDPSLKVLSFEFLFMNDDDAAFLGQSLSGNTNLKELDLRFYDTDYSIQSVQSLVVGIHGSGVTMLKVHIGSLRTVLRKRLLQGIQQSRRIEVLHISASEHEPAVDLEGVFSIPSLQKVCLHDGEFSIKSIAHGLQQATSLFKLEFSGTWHLRRKMRPLSLALAANSSITAFALHGTRLDTHDFAVFVEHWSPNSPIQELYIVFNAIGDRGVRLLMNAIPHHPALRFLRIAFDAELGHEGLVHIGNGLPYCGSSFTRLSIHHTFCKCTPATRAVATHALLDGLRANSFITEVDAAHNGLSDQVLNEIQFYCDINRLGKNLLRLEHGLPASVWSHVLAKCSTNASCMFYHLTEQPNLVGRGTVNH